MDAGLPGDKLGKARTLLLAFRSKHKVNLKKLQSLIGVLNFVSRLSFQAGPFCGG